MEVRFGVRDLELFAVEGEGVLGVSLVKSEGAVGPVRVRLSTLGITASGKPLSLLSLIDFCYLQCLVI